MEGRERIVAVQEIFKLLVLNMPIQTMGGITAIREGHEADTVCHAIGDLLDHYISRSSQGWVR